MSVMTAPGIAPIRTGTAHADRDTASPRLSLFGRCGAWLQRRADAARLREVDPRLARDVGAAPAPAERAVEGFAVDPRPFWGIGLTPQPLDVLPPWSRDHRRG